MCPPNAEEFLRKPFTLHFFGVSYWGSEKYRSEGLEQPFTALHCPSLSFGKRLHDGVFLSRYLLFFEIRYKITKNYLSEDENRWRVVKGSEGLRQPFTILTYWYSDIYTEKVKGEGFSQKFFCTDNIRLTTTVSIAVSISSEALLFASEAFWCTSEAFWCTSEGFWCASAAFWQTAEALWRRFCSRFCQTLQPLNNLSFAFA